MIFTHRPRRLRQYHWLRNLVAESSLHASDLICPLFILPGKDRVEPIASMPGVFRYSIDKAMDMIESLVQLGVPAIAIFPVVDHSLKSLDANEALNPYSLACTAARTFSQKFPGIGLIGDIALDPYTSHGHDGLLVERNGQWVVDNDNTVSVLAQMAVIHAQAGFNVLAPSDMMDGRIGFIRKELDTNHLEHVVLLSYAAKYASAFYGPFRDAIGSKNSLASSDKKTYQMDPRNWQEAIREVRLDIEEGADMVMVKPGLPYLDIIRNVKNQFQIPTIAYQVSGEYSMLRVTADAGHIHYQSSMLESLLSFKRAGADAILTYAAQDVAIWLSQVN